MNSNDPQIQEVREFIESCLVACEGVESRRGYRSTTDGRPSDEMVCGTSGCTDFPSGCEATLQALAVVSPAAKSLAAIVKY